MEQASNGLKLTDLNDFINPSKTCVKPLITENDNIHSNKNETVLLKKKSVSTSTNIKDGENVINKSVGKIKLDDCLACSGCVTSAEVVFIEQQSFNEFLEFLSANCRLPNLEKQTLVVSVSPQSVLSLAQSFNLSIDGTVNLILDYFKKRCDAKFVFNHLEINHICLRESAFEFVQLYKEALTKGKNVRVFSSSCPGWACYAEKRCQTDVVDQLSHVRSIQGVMGGLIKRILPFDAQKIYHLAVMPCFDRKLEAARPDMVLSSSPIDKLSLSGTLNALQMKETDIVVTTFELYQQLLSAYGLSQNQVGLDNVSGKMLSSVSDQTMYFDSIYTQSACTKNHLIDYPILYRNIGGESGGLAINIFINACKLLFNVNVEVTEGVKTGVTLETVSTNNSSYKIQHEYVKSSDYYEFWLEKINSDNSTKILLRFAKVYGFRSIQNMLIRLKKLPENYYQYIEVMACPNGGCLNGGGQVLFHTENSILKKNQQIKDIRNNFIRLPISSDNNDIPCPDVLSYREIPLKTSFRKLLDQLAYSKAENHFNDTGW